MFLTEQEIMTQHEALAKTYEYMMGLRPEIERFFKENPRKKFVFFGCGSSYMLSKSGERLFASCPGTAASAIAGGDYLVNPAPYTEALRDAIVVTLSRSGQTSEIVRDVKQIKETLGCPVVSFSMKADNQIMAYSNLDVTMDWCYDKSVCQTRTVTNLYTAMLLFKAFYAGDEALIRSIKAACDQNEAYKNELRPVLAELAKKEWDNVVVLADGAMVGLAEEGALAFTEIALIPGRCFNLLDYRHGPIVLNNKTTLTIALIQPGSKTLQQDMVADLVGHGGTVVTVSGDEDKAEGVAANVPLSGIECFDAWGIPFIYVMQMLSYSKSIELGGNPDAPTGLNAFITLK